MRRKWIPFLIAAAVLLAGLAVYTAASRSQTAYQIIGEAYGKASDQSGDPIVAMYKDTPVRQSVVDYHRQSTAVLSGGEEPSEADTIAELLRNIIMVDEAESRGLSVTQDEVDSEIAGQRQNYEDFAEIREVVDGFCAGAGITTEEYYASLEEQMPHIILRWKLRDALGREYCEEHGLDYVNGNGPTEMEDAVNRYLDGLVESHRADITYYK